MSIEWGNGAVCFDGIEGWFASGENNQLVSRCGSYGAYIGDLISNDNFQLNKMREGDYIEGSELDTEQKYNGAVEVFRLFGFSRSGPFALTYREFIRHELENALVCSGKLLMGINYANGQCKRKINYPQLMAIGKLKRAMIERDEALINAVENTSTLSDALNGNCSESPNSSEPTMGSVNAGSLSNKSKQAYAILKALDYEYDLVKQRWYKKEWA